MRSKRYKIAATLIAVLMCPDIAAATEFACDAPSDKSNSVSLTISGETRIAGAIRKMELRDGRFMPLAGARLVGTDGIVNLGFELAAPSPDATEFEVVVNFNRGDGHRSEIIGRIPTGETIPFSMILHGNGDASVEIRDYKYAAKFVPLPEGKGVFFCSTGQFQFSDLTASTNIQKPSAPSSPH